MDQNQVRRTSLNTTSNNSFISLSENELVQQFLFNTITYGVIFLTGSFNFNPIWLLFPIIFSVMQEHRRTKKKLNQQHLMRTALTKDEQLVSSNIDHLPAWVNFPDVERCEWFNKVLAHLWPNINEYFIKVLKTSIEPKVNEKMSAYIKNGFEFKILSLGSIPPRFSGVKVYDKNTNRNEIVMDINLFYAGDCDISFVILGLTGGIQNIEIRGLLRFVMKPLIPIMPLIGGVDIFFVNNPIIDFNMVGITGFFDLPGLSGKLHQVIKDQIALLMVQPKCFHISLSDVVVSDKSHFLEYEGVLHVHVIEANDLSNKDFSLNKKDVSDPYVILSVGEKVHKSEVVHNSLNPKWNFSAEFVIESIFDDTALNVKVMDKDEYTDDSFLGSVSIELSLIKQKQKLKSWFQLDDTKKGMIHLSLTFCHLSSHRGDYSYDSSTGSFMSTSLLCIYVDSANNLLVPRSELEPNSCVQLSVGSSVLTSKTVVSNCPVFKEVFTFLVKNPEIDKLQIKLVDQKSNTNMGQMSLALEQVLNKNKMEIVDQSYPLTQSAADSTITLSLRLKVLLKN